MLKVHAVEDWLLWHLQNNFVNSANSCKELDALSTSYLLYSYFCGTIVTKLLPKKKRFI